MSKRSRLYTAWLNMRNRCNNSRGQDYAYYGGRGITVCPAWDSFKQFARDVGPHPGKGWTLDRKRNNQGYYKGNVRWATRQTQSRNRSYCTANSALAATIRREYIRGTNSYIRGNARWLMARYGISQGVLSHIICKRAWA